MLSRRYIISNEVNDYFSVIHHVINHYIQNNFSYLTIPLSLPQLSIVTNIKESTLQEQVTRVPSLYSKAFNLEDPQKSLELRQRLISDVFAWALSDKAMISQLNSLLSSDLTYIDAATGKPKVALQRGTLLVKGIEADAKLQASILNLIDKLVPQTQLTQIINLQSQGKEKVTYLTKAEAIEILSEEAQLALNSPDNMRLLAAKHHLDEAPEVRASGAIDTDGTFIKSSKQSLIPEAQDTLLYSIEEELSDEDED